MDQFYFAYFIENNRIEERRSMNATNDADAIAFAQLWHDGRPLEVWRNFALGVRRPMNLWSLKVIRQTLAIRPALLLGG